MSVLCPLAASSLIDVPDYELTAVAMAIKRQQDCIVQGAGRVGAQFVRDAVRNAGRTPVFVDFLTLLRSADEFEVHLAASGVGQAPVDADLLVATVARCDRWSVLVVTVSDLPTQGRALAALAAIRDRAPRTVPLLVLGAASPMAVRALLGGGFVAVVLPEARPGALDDFTPAVLGSDARSGGPAAPADAVAVLTGAPAQASTAVSISPESPARHRTVQGFSGRTQATPDDPPGPPPVFNTAPYGGDS